MTDFHQGKGIRATEHDDGHIVEADLRVMIVKENDTYVAMCIDIDYVASGNSADEVRANFVNGLARTIGLHLDRFGDVDRLNRRPPPEILELWANVKNQVIADPVTQALRDIEADIAISERARSAWPSFFNDVRFVREAAVA